MTKEIKIKQEFSEEAMHLFSVLKSWYEKDKQEATRCKDAQQAVTYLVDHYSEEAWDAGHKQWVEGRELT